MTMDYARYIKNLFPNHPDFRVDTSEFGIDDGFQIVENDEPVGGMSWINDHWLVWLDYYDTGSRDEPPSWYDKPVGEYDSFTEAMVELATAIRRRDIEQIVEMIQGG